MMIWTSKILEIFSRSLPGSFKMFFGKTSLLIKRKLSKESPKEQKTTSKDIVDMQVETKCEKECKPVVLAPSCNNEKAKERVEKVSYTEINNEVCAFDELDSLPMVNNLQYMIKSRLDA